MPHDAHHIDPRSPSDGESDDENNTVASEGETSREDDNHDSFDGAMAPPAKRAKKSQGDVVASCQTRKTRKVIESDDDEDDALLAEMDELLKDVDPLAFD